MSEKKKIPFQRPVFFTVLLPELDASFFKGLIWDYQDNDFLGHSL